LTSVLADLPSDLLINATGIGSLKLTDIRDTKLFPTRGQTLLVSEPKTPISRMYEFERLNKYEARVCLQHNVRQCKSNTDYDFNRYLRSPKRIDPTTTYVFPRPNGGGVILGGSRDENNWSEEFDEELGKQIMERCCKLCPELGKPEDIQVISKNVGLRRKCGVLAQDWVNC
jgi:D-amino-acid oxidase